MFILALLLVVSITQLPGVSHCRPATPDDLSASDVFHSIKNGELVQINSINMKCDVWE